MKYLNFKDGFYIECGANDGVNQSNTWYFEKSLNWKRILIEPNKKSFSELKKIEVLKIFLKMLCSSPKILLKKEKVIWLRIIK